jgi:hypothetical protein
MHCCFSLLSLCLLFRQSALEICYFLCFGSHHDPFELLLVGRATRSIPTSLLFKLVIFSNCACIYVCTLVSQAVSCLVHIKLIQRLHLAKNKAVATMHWSKYFYAPAYRNCSSPVISSLQTAFLDCLLFWFDSVKFHQRLSTH